MGLEGIKWVFVREHRINRKWIGDAHFTKQTAPMKKSVVVVIARSKVANDDLAKIPVECPRPITSGERSVFLSSEPEDNWIKWKSREASKQESRAVWNICTCGPLRKGHSTFLTEKKENVQFGLATPKARCGNQVENSSNWSQQVEYSSLHELPFCYNISHSLLCIKCVWTIIELCTRHIISFSSHVISIGGTFWPLIVVVCRRPLRIYPEGQRALCLTFLREFHTQVILELMFCQWKPFFFCIFE